MQRSGESIGTMQGAFCLGSAHTGLAGLGLIAATANDGRLCGEFNALTGKLQCSGRGD